MRSMPSERFCFRNGTDLVPYFVNRALASAGAHGLSNSRRSEPMGARRKLNQAYFNGALVCGAAIGLATGSWLYCALVFFLCLAGSCYDGGIRTGGGRR